MACPIWKPRAIDDKRDRQLSEVLSPNYRDECVPSLVVHRVPFPYGLQCQGSHNARVKLARRRRKYATASRGALTAPQLEPKSVATGYITYVKGRIQNASREGSGNSITSLVQHFHRASCYSSMDVLCFNPIPLTYWLSISTLSVGGVSGHH